MTRFPIYQCVFMKRLAAVVIVALALVGCANDRQFDECAEDGSCAEGFRCVGTPSGAQCWPTCADDETCRDYFDNDDGVCSASGTCTVRCQRDDDCPSDLPACHPAAFICLVRAG